MFHTFVATIARLWVNWGKQIEEIFADIFRLQIFKAKLLCNICNILDLFSVYCAVSYQTTLQMKSQAKLLVAKAPVRLLAVLYQPAVPFYTQEWK
jgi:hypothetical protein